MSGFYDANAIERLAINLFYGWGYNFYRVENQLRADDLKIRSNIGLLLGQARKAIEEAESAYRREHLPPPSREKPLPDPRVVATAQKIEELARRLGQAEAQVRAAPAPESDRMTQRYRSERETLVRLAELDTRLVGQVEFLRQIATGEPASRLLESASLIEASLKSIGELLFERQQLLV